MVSPTEAGDEGSKFGIENMRGLQDNPAPESGAGHMQGPQAQATTGQIRKGVLNAKDLGR